jgi:hypothetical protein
MVSESLFPSDKEPPFYVVAPRYIRTSAGIKALHLLCHWLNQIGYRSYLHIDPPWTGSTVSSELATPLLTQSVVDFDFERGLTPIVILPEILHGNPLSGGLVARFLGNYPGLLGGPKTFSDDEKIIAYSEKIAEAIETCFATLHIPTIDTRVFRPPVTNIERNGSCAYLGKYKDVHGGEPFGLPDGTVIFGRDQIGDLTPKEIRDLFYEKTYFYAFEDTALLVEAALCGCVPILMLNEHFSVPLGLKEFNYAGFAVGASESEIGRAKETLPEVAEIYSKMIREFPKKLEILAGRLAAEALQQPYEKPVTLPKSIPFVPDLVLPDGRIFTLSFARNYIADRGLPAFLWASFRWCLRMARRLRPW